jgi:capsule polysaccharide export protein KpsE/RkpR
VNPPRQTDFPAIGQPPELEPEANGYSSLTETAPLDPKYIVWLRLLWGEARFLGRVMAYGAVVAVLIALALPKRYKSTISLMPPDNQSGMGLGMGMTALMAAKGNLSSMGGLGGSLAGAASDLLGLKNSTALFNDMLGGRTIEDRMVQRFDLRKEYGSRFWEGARKQLARNTDIVVDRKSDVMTITVEDRDPQRAQQMATAYVEELDRLLAEVSTSSARRERMFIEQRLQTVKKDLERASKEFSEYASKNTVLDMPYQAKAMVEAAAQLQGQLIVAQSQLEGLEQIYTPNNVRVRSLKARVSELKDQLSHMSGTSTPPGTGPGADSSASDLYPPIRQLPLVGVEWANLYREAKMQDTIFELLTQQYEFAKIEEAKEIPTVKILDRANVPERKSFPPRTVIVIVGTLFSFVLGALFVLASAHWREIDPHSPGKQFAEQVWLELRERFASNGSKPWKVVSRVWKGQAEWSTKEEEED